MDLTVLNKYNLDSCGKPIITLSAAGDCNTNRPDIIPINPDGSSPIDTAPGKVDKYAARVNVRACIVRLPREITRQISFNCRTQRVETAVKYRIQGYDSFTPDKMDEVERIFFGQKIWVNGIEVQFEGGSVFEPLGQNYPNEYRLNVEVSECPTRITYGCGSNINCGPPKYTFVIPDGIADMSRYFNSNNQIVADTFENLMAYYRAQPGVASVTEVTSEHAGDCIFNRAFEVTTYDVTPESFFVGQISPRNRVFGRRLDEVSEFCEGLPAVGSCVAPILGVPVIEDTSCDAPVLGTPIIESETCGIELQNGWIDVDGGTQVKSVNGETKLSITVQKSGLTPTPVNEYDEVIYDIDFGGPVCYWHNEELIGRNVYDIEAVMIDGAAIDSTLYIFDSVEGSITFLDPCPNVMTDMRIIFKAGQSEGDIIVNQTIARISQSCAPLVQYTAPSEDVSPIMPPGGTVTITTDGDVIFNGSVFVSPDPAGDVAKIILLNISFFNQ